MSPFILGMIKQAALRTKQCGYTLGEAIDIYKFAAGLLPNEAYELEAFQPETINRMAAEYRALPTIHPPTMQHPIHVEHPPKLPHPPKKEIPATKHPASKKAPETVQPKRKEMPETKRPPTVEMPPLLEHPGNK